ncbi:hypothetical protein KBC86_04315 [Candidatus Gracilibacteria bacterium]|nr:hypothetical protein [Candidatus Gracilibacteria bacterium]
MDIKTLIPSSIKKSGELYEVRLPNFYGFVEGVLYMHDSVTIDYCSGVFGTKLDMSEWKDPLESVFLMSQIFGMVLVRIVHALHPSDDRLITARALKIVTFRIRNNVHFGILYYDEDRELRLLTDFNDSSIFRSSFENGMWTISNTLTGANLYCFSFPFELPDEAYTMITSSKRQYEFFLLEDPLFREKGEKIIIENAIKSIIDNEGEHPHMLLEKIGDTMAKITLYQSDRGDEEDPISVVKKLIGIIGNHLIITEDNDILPEYLSTEEVNDMDREDIEGFTFSEEIEFFDPKWHSLRVMLLKFGYLVYSLEKHILLTKDTLEDIEQVRSPHLEHQAHRSKLTLDGLTKIKEQYQNTLKTLLKSIKHSQNLI